jgi:hypothetical protein
MVIRLIKPDFKQCARLHPTGQWHAVGATSPASGDIVPAAENGRA